MPKAIAEADTFLKKRLLASQELTDAEKIFVPKGHVFYVSKYVPDRNQHLYLTLASPLTAKDGKTQLQMVYAYGPHIRIEGSETQQVIKLPVTYRSQINNETTLFGSGRRQCNLTSCTMLADYLLKGALSKWAKDRGFSEPESVYMRILIKYGDTTDNDAQTKALKALGIDSYFSFSLSTKDVLDSLQAGIPVVVGFAYGSGGHICLVVGHDPIHKLWLVHDPFGIRHGASDAYDIGAYGAYDHYSYDVFQQLFLDSGGNTGWGRIVTSIANKPTGMPTGL
jgi:hypothetical protein